MLDEPGPGRDAATVLDTDAEYITALLDLMELRTALTKKNDVDQDRVERLIRKIETELDAIYHEPSDLFAANELQSETLLYPLDCLRYAIAEDQDATLVTFDSELTEAGASSPSDVLS